MRGPARVNGGTSDGSKTADRSAWTWSGIAARTALTVAVLVVMVIAAASGGATGRGLAHAHAQSDRTPTSAATPLPAVTPAPPVPCAAIPPSSVALPPPPLTSPVASPAGSPVASPVGATPTMTVSVPAPTLAGELERSARTLAACLTAGPAESLTVTLLATPRFLGQLAVVDGPLSPDEYLALAPDLPVVPVTIRGIANATLITPDQATADVTYAVGNQLVRGRWTFTRGIAGDGTSDELTSWSVDAEAPLPTETPTDAATSRVRLSEYTVAARPGSLAGPAVVLDVRNGGAEAHEVLVLRLDDGVTTDALLTQTGPALPAGMTFVGQVTVPASERAELILVDLAPGTYALVCLLPDAEGTPHLAFGEETTVVIE